MADFPKDIYTEPEPDVDTLANLGPLSGMAGIWTGTRGLDVNPKPDGPEKQAFIEHMELQPIDAQTNGPQLFYGLRYHTRIVKPDDVETFHDQVGYWLWEPATGTVIQTLSIPRGQTAMAVGRAAADARTFRLQAVRGSETNGIVSNPFLEYAFRTESYIITVSINVDGTWSYEQDTVLIIPGQAEPFHHTDRNTLRKIGEPTPNPTAQAKPGEIPGALGQARAVCGSGKGWRVRFDAAQSGEFLRNSNKNQNPERRDPQSGLALVVCVLVMAIRMICSFYHRFPGGPNGVDQFIMA